MTKRFQLIEMDDAQQRVQYWCIHKTGIVVRTVYSQNSPHNDDKDTVKRAKSQIYLSFSEREYLRRQSKIRKID